MRILYAKERQGTSRRKRRRRTLVFGLLAGAAMAIAACSSSGTGGGSGGTVHLTYALWDPHEEVGYKASIAEFEKLHPNISVTVEQIPYPEYAAKITTDFTSGNGPDVFWVDTPEIPTWIQDGIMQNIMPDVKKYNVNLAQYYPSLVGLHEYDGALYGLPKDWDTIGIFYNKAYFQKHHITIPSNLTWSPTGSSSFLRLLQEATIDSSGKNATQPGFNPNKISTYGISMPNSIQTGWDNYLAMDGANFLSKNYGKTVGLNSPAATSTFTFLTDLLTKYHVAAPASELGSNGEAADSQDIQLFARGDVAMLEEGDWNTLPISQAANFPIGVMMLPAGPQGRVSVFNGLVDAISTHTAYPQQAWELEQWLGSPASEKIMGSGGYIWPGIESLDSTYLDYWKKKGIDMQPFLTEAKGKTVTYPIAPGGKQAITEATNDLGPAYLGTSSVAQAVSAAATAANQALGSAG
jgi:multiple sugar transport system substrate-binding protein